MKAMHDPVRRFDLMFRREHAAALARKALRDAQQEAVRGLLCLGCSGLWFCTVAGKRISLKGVNPQLPAMDGLRRADLVAWPTARISSDNFPNAIAIQKGLCSGCRAEYAEAVASGNWMDLPVGIHALLV